ncbi:hypothetical protein H1C71_029900 [Ictidomys tridecemlineatus]|nr:hypothetical protein H1C71_029900 [Ictidomys tridecemlineatus]KAG3260194.1 hypothetical protein H1C71_029900 [Ictidomys tridecemlineatus]
MTSFLTNHEIVTQPPEQVSCPQVVLDLVTGLRLVQTDLCGDLVPDTLLEHNHRSVSPGVLCLLCCDLVKGTSNGFHPGSVTGGGDAGRSFCMELGTGSLHGAEQKGRSPQGNGFGQHQGTTSQFVGQKSELRLAKLRARHCRTVFWLQAPEAASLISGRDNARKENCGSKLPPATGTGVSHLQI